ncbi:hypothetical protein [Actinomadura chokoriensis]|uniref:hypothetical protein n=1 Tax=Actinomadura chokoriensis TaxID=454156 RepID=UPI0031F8705F
MDRPRTAAKECSPPDGRLREGAFPAWPLPPGPRAAGTARAIVRSVFAELGVAPAAIGSPTHAEGAASSSWTR